VPSAHTRGAAHIEILTPGTAEHEVLSWELAKQCVAYDVGRTQTLTAAPAPVGLAASARSAPSAGLSTRGS
jgi:arylamine N-acetyltransferase